VAGNGDDAQVNIPVTYGNLRQLTAGILIACVTLA